MSVVALRMEPRPEQAPVTALSLTPRGRVLLGMAVLLTVVLIATGVGRAGAAGSGPRVVTVQPGQTLSHVAVRELPALPVGTAVAEFQLTNRLNTSHVHAGQRLVVPELG